jgi:RimJ/RimL family protein N-acetyltransferase
MRKWVNDTAATRYLSHIFTPPQTVAMTEDFLERVISGRSTDYNFVIADRETEAYIGQIDLVNLNTLDRTAELGVVIGDPARQNRGIGGEAIRLLLEFAFCHANLQRVELWVNAGNARAIHCYEKCGFVHEGRRRSAHFENAGYADMLLMGALREEWLEANRAR